LFAVKVLKYGKKTGFFGPFGLSPVIVHHWDNLEGGFEVDTSRCFLGNQRFEILASQLD